MSEQEIIIIIFVIFLGLIFGSFATAVAYRLPKKIDFIKDRSKCPNCNHILGILDLFPILSWIILRGKCRYCKKQFGISYIFTEISLSLLYLVIYLTFGISFVTLILMLLSLIITITFLIKNNK